MELHTKNLKILPCTKQFFSSVSTNYPLGQHIKNYLDELNKDPSLLGWGVWFVIEKETNQIVGDIGFKGKPNLENTVEVGYGILPSFQNKGYATEAVRELLNWAFSNSNVTKIIAECIEDNDSSIRVLEKLNMGKVGLQNHMIKWQLEKSSE
ncbi:GNAT family N-acetyltransferase [Ureibacillus sp. 179-F W5.1 NHS]|uniref:GNAT family N-acetyltransferase n=1 Tax=Ureibacillus sp. 179-F W5.1 NHS TaxID=3374297 RepID=UPI00387953DB